MTGIVSWITELQSKSYINIHALFYWYYWSFGDSDCVLKIWTWIHERMVIFQPSIYYNYWSHCNWKFDSNFGTRNHKFFHDSVIILEQMIDKLWPELRNFNPEIMSTFMHYSTEIIGLLVIKNVYWKFELVTKKRW